MEAPGVEAGIRAPCRSRWRDGFVLFRRRTKPRSSTWRNTSPNFAGSSETKAESSHVRINQQDRELHDGMLQMEEGVQTPSGPSGQRREAPQVGQPVGCRAILNGAARPGVGELNGVDIHGSDQAVECGKCSCVAPRRGDGKDARTGSEGG